MLGVSLVTADDWILRHYAATGIGDITRLTFAKRLFAVPSQSWSGDRASLFAVFRPALQ